MPVIVVDIWQPAQDIDTPFKSDQLVCFYVLFTAIKQFICYYLFHLITCFRKILCILFHRQNDEDVVTCFRTGKAHPTYGVRFSGFILEKSEEHVRDNICKETEAGNRHDADAKAEYIALALVFPEILLRCTDICVFVQWYSSFPIENRNNTAVQELVRIGLLPCYSSSWLTLSLQSSSAPIV